MRPEERLAKLRAAELAGDPIAVLPFYGHRPNPNGSVGIGCLSQWWAQPFTVEGVTYPTAEHWMMAGKARLFNDADGLAEILAAPSPGAAKAAGRRVRQFDEATWRAASYDIVVAGNVAKFGQNDDLAEFLRRTGRRILAEASPFDRIWGIGMARTHPDVDQPTRWRGLNLLGFALMDVRERL
jgi:ribA/ribD-fused uncharacterized protein